jgi:hypothetical protein
LFIDGHIKKKEIFMKDSLILAVVEQLGHTKEDLDNKNEELFSTLGDIVNHGIDGGFTGFTYYTDTHEFFKRNRKDIVNLVRDIASDLSYTSIKLVSSFSCIKDSFEEEELEEQVALCLYDDLEDYDRLISNALAWFAAEEVARYLTE